MFRRFTGRYPLPQGAPAASWSHPALVGVVGYPELATSAAGLPLCDGLIRVVTRDEGASASEFVRLGFPEFATRAVPFAVDWLGRVFAVDRARSPGLVLVEPGSGRVFEIDESLVDFFNIDLVDDPDTFLAADLFRDWQNHGGRAPGINECVGFKVPLFLGGSGTPANLEITDLDVYWAFSRQLRSQTLTLAPGTAVVGADAVDPSDGV